MAIAAAQNPSAAGGGVPQRAVSSVAQTRKRSTSVLPGQQPRNYNYKNFIYLI